MRFLTNRNVNSCIRCRRHRRRIHRFSRRAIRIQRHRHWHWRLKTKRKTMMCCVTIIIFNCVSQRRAEPELRLDQALETIILKMNIF